MTYLFDSDFKAAGNTWGKRKGNIKGVCIHHAAATHINLTPTFLANGTSAHYGVAPEHIRQFLDDEMSAWATGNDDGNWNWISIECVNSHVGGEWPVSNATIHTLCEFLANKADEWGIEEYRVGVNLKGHRDFSATYCPGVLYVALPEIARRANAIMKGEDDMTYDDVYKAASAAIWDNRGNIADAVFDKPMEGKSAYWTLQAGAEAAWNANQALHNVDPTGRCDMPPLEQLRYMAEKQAKQQEQLDHIEAMILSLVEDK